MLNWDFVLVSPDGKTNHLFISQNLDFFCGDLQKSDFLRRKKTCQTNRANKVRLQQAAPCFNPLQGVWNGWSARRVETPLLQMRRPPSLISFSQGLSQTSSGSFVVVRLSASQSPSAERTLKEPRHIPVKTTLCGSRFMSPTKDQLCPISSRCTVAPGLSSIEFITWMKRAIGPTVQPRTHFVKPGSRRGSGVGDLPRRVIFVREKRRVSTNDHTEAWDD